MNTRVTAILIALIWTVARADKVLEGDFARITIGTNTFTNAHLRAYSLTEGSLRHDGGVEKIKLSDLPEPERAKFYNPQKAAEEAAATRQAAAMARAAHEEQARAVASAQRRSALGGMPYAPYRIVNGRSYDLTPIYQWMMSGRQGPCPMSGWIGGQSENQLPYETYTVLEVLPDALLVQCRGYAPYPIGEFSRMFALTNYPYRDKATDNQLIRFLALLSGNFRYQNTAGAISTINLYDYGVACDPPAPPRTNNPSANTDLKFSDKAAP